MNTTELLTDVYSRLSAITSKSYYEQAPQTTTLPYMVYEIINTDIGIDTSKRNDYTMRVNIWANSDDITTLETLADSVADINLNKDIDTNQSMFYNLISKLNIPTSDENLRRRELTFTIRTYPIG